MRSWISVLLLMCPAFAADEKIGFDDRVEIVRGLTSEYATVKAPLPKSKKPLPFESTGQYDAKQWEQIGKELGPAARTGDMIQVTRVTLESDKVLLEINDVRPSFGSGPISRKLTDFIARNRVVLPGRRSPG